MAVIACWAGTQNATVMGSIFSSGNAVAGVTVRLINASTAFSQTQTSSADGTFTFSDVPPAENYVISVEKTGFSPMVLTSVMVQVGEEKLVLPPFLLQSAAPAPLQAPVPTPSPTSVPTPAPSQAPAPARKAPSVTLDLLSSTESGVIDSQLVHTLPLVNRDFIDLALLVPGTFPVEQGSALQGASLAVNGARADMNNFLLDGADNNDYTVNQSLPFQIVEAMQEFRVQTSTTPNMDAAEARRLMSSAAAGAMRCTESFSSLTVTQPWPPAITSRTTAAAVSTNTSRPARRLAREIR